MSSVPNTILDRLLAVQLGVAWAGEGRCEPRRLGWWDTDLIDDEGGGDLLRRLMPRSHAWASFQAVREAARRVDSVARKRMAEPDSVRTLFHLGFEVDELLTERLLELKRQGKAPVDVLPHLPDIKEGFAKDSFAAWLQVGGQAAFKVEAGGRALKGDTPPALELQGLRLASALMPFADKYPMPFFRVGAS